MFNSKKRSRGQNEDESELRELNQDHKKPRTLPFRTSPTVKHTLLFSQSPRQQPKPLLTPSITPEESSADEDELPILMSSSAPCVQHSKLTVPFQSFANDLDADTDMMDSQCPSSPPPVFPTMSISTPSRPSPASFQPSASSRDPQNLNNGGRIATPRWDHFRCIDTTIDMIDAPETTSYDFAPTNAALAPSQRAVDHSVFLRRRRLPSPISEDENKGNPTAMTEKMMSTLDMGNTTNSHNPSSDAPRKGRSSISNLGATGSTKIMLSMGYRADCEKCRTRVPGHYSHLIRVPI